MVKYLSWEKKETGIKITSSNNSKHLESFLCNFTLHATSSCRLKSPSFGGNISVFAIGKVMK